MELATGWTMQEWTTMVNNVERAVLEQLSTRLRVVGRFDTYKLFQQCYVMTFLVQYVCAFH